MTDGTGMTASETLLSKIWDTPEEDAAWAHLSPGVDFEDVLEEAMEDKGYR